MSATALTARPARRPAGAEVLDRAIDAVAARRDADLALLQAAVAWGESHPVPDAEHESYARWEHPSLHGEGIVPLAGDGAPLVAEFAPDELAAAIGWPVTTTRSWMGDGLELKYRLPLLFDLLVRGVVPLHLARYVSEQTRDLPREAAAYADRLVSSHHARLNRPRIRAWVDEARLYHDPDRQVDDEQRALAARKVELWPGDTPATTDVMMRLDSCDADAFDRAVTRTAEALKRSGDTDDLDVRRAKAVGVLADPQRALELLTGDPGRTPESGARAGSGRAGAVLWLHLDESRLREIDTFPSPVHVEGLGTVSSDLLAMWLADTRVVVTPVLDLARPDAIDGHDPPGWMADLVRLRDRHCVFPGCCRASRDCDLDHIEPYVPLDEDGPPGQTNPDNLAPLCRRHHRAKTHTRWHYARLPDGTYHWTSPLGRTYAVVPQPGAVGSG
jgi:hypothetical protein